MLAQGIRDAGCPLRAGCLGAASVSSEKQSPRTITDRRILRMTDYVAEVQRYDSGADADVVQKIVKHLGIALRSKDASLVSCSDQSELDRVREKWCTKKLGATDADAANAIIAKVCETMKGDRQKQRVTFYYLVAKEMGKLGDL
jgi:hypothetical protein